MTRADTIPQHVVYPFRVSHGRMINICYIVVDQLTRKAAVVDPAWDMGEILHQLAKLNVEPELILLTHSHLDHVQLAAPLAIRFGSRVYMGKREIEYYSFRCPNLSPVTDGQTVWLGQAPIRCLLTPGHTAGSICYLLPGSMFTGDTIFIEGCGICDGAGGSAGEMYNSVQYIKEIVDPSVRVYPGHSFGEEPGHPLQYLLDHNIYFNFQSREQFITFRTRKNQQRLFDFK